MTVRVLMAVSLLFAACGAVADAPISVPPIRAGAVYVTSSGFTATGSDNPVFARLPDQADDISLGRTVPVTAIGSNVVLLMSADGSVRAVRVARSPSVPYARERAGNLPVALATREAVYVAESGGLTVVDARGVARTQHVPAARPGTASFCVPRRGQIETSASSVRSLAAVGSRAIAFASTWLNGLVVDLGDGRMLELPGSGAALSMVGGPNGRLYALTQDPTCDTSNWLVREIDVNGMREERVIDTRVPGGAFVHLELVASRAGVFLHVVRDDSAQLIRVDGPAPAAPITVPEPAGIRAAGAPDGSIYVFGGRARNVVRRLDPAISTFSEVPGLAGPAGTFVNAVLFLD